MNAMTDDHDPIVDDGRSESVSPLSPATLLRALARFPTGVVGLCAMVDGRPVGMAASSFTSVSLDPPLVSVCVAHSSTTWPVLRRARRLGVSVFSVEGEIACRKLAAKGTDRFTGLAWLTGAYGSVFLDLAVLHIDTSIDFTVPAGDHDIVLLRVRDAIEQPGRAPLVFHDSSYRHIAD